MQSRSRFNRFDFQPHGSAVQALVATSSGESIVFSSYCGLGPFRLNCTSVLKKKKATVAPSG